jgi:hypothetical protein
LLGCLDQLPLALEKEDTKIIKLSGDTILIFQNVCLEKVLKLKKNIYILMWYSNVLIELFQVIIIISRRIPSSLTGVSLQTLIGTVKLQLFQLILHKVFLNF